MYLPVTARALRGMSTDPAQSAPDMAPHPPSLPPQPDTNGDGAWPPEGAAKDGPDGDGRIRTPFIPPRAATERETLVLGVFLAAMVLVCVYLLLALWPAVEAATAERPHATVVHLFSFAWRPTPEVVLLLLVAFSSALGGSLHATISFTDYVGNRRLATSWIWWYVLRVHLGTALAVLFYFALRGGLFSANTPTNVINPFGIAALAGLVGLFHKQATDKLRELFDTMFRTAPGQGDDQRGDSIVNPHPVMGGVEPTRVPSDGSKLTVHVRGEGFIPQSVVRVGRTRDARGPFIQRRSRFVSPTELEVTLDPADILEAATVYLTVLNPPPGGGTSGAAELEVAPDLGTPGTNGAAPVPVPA
jgi:hypothetical protein